MDGLCRWVMVRRGVDSYRNAVFNSRANG
ncbi:protein of unknown function [Candidatus Methylocalor cossyra]|uniref:Transposase n=1 Tax=Candidatus Methylocalor cossyra TaxID=3108543 RepID=A0ABM9NIM9_9GAMM